MSFGLDAQGVTIREYVSEHYPGYVIVEWKRKSRTRQQVKLGNGLELIFLAKGSFIKID